MDNGETWPAFSKCPVIAELQRTTPPGRCVFCGRPSKQLVRSRTKFICFRADCAMAYQTEYKRWKRAELVAQGLTQRGKQRKSQHPRWRLPVEPEFGDTHE